MDYVEGQNVTDNKNLAEAIDMTREGSAPPNSDYDKLNSEGQSTKRDSCFFVAIEELENIESAPKDSQEIINDVLNTLRDKQNASNQERSRIMADCHRKLQNVFVPSESK